MGERESIVWYGEELECIENKRGKGGLCSGQQNVMKGNKREIKSHIEIERKK